MRHWLCVLVFLVACDPAVRFQTAPGSARRPALSSSTVQVLGIAEWSPLPPGVDYQGHDEPSYQRFDERCDALVVTRPHPGVAFLGTIDAVAGDVDEAFLRRIAETAAAHGANQVYLCGKRYFAFWVQLDPAPAAADAMAPVMKLAAADGYQPAGTLRTGELGGKLALPFAADTCYAVGFALDRSAGWGELAEAELAVHLGGLQGRAARARPASEAPGARPFEAARAGWQVIGCFHVGFEQDVNLVPGGEPRHAAGQGPVAFQLFSRPPTSDERARLDRLVEHDRRRMAMCNDCAPLMATCAQADYTCPAFDRCLADQGEHNPHMCGGQPFPKMADWDPQP